MKTTVSIWFACSVAVPVIANAILYFWLRRKGVSMVLPCQARQATSTSCMRGGAVNTKSPPLEFYGFALLRF